MKRLLLAGGILALAVLTLLLLRLDGVRTNAAVSRSVPELDARDEVPSTRAPDDVERTEARVLAVETVGRAANSAPNAPTSIADSAPRPLALFGTVVVPDEEGLERRAEDGTFSLVLWSGNRGRHHEVAVEDGAWRTELPAGPTIEHLGCTGIRLGGRTAVPSARFAEKFALPIDGRLDLVVRWPKSTLLYVRDRASGRELAPILVAPLAGWPESGYGHPGPRGSSAQDLGPSPVRIPEAESAFFGGTRAVHARSPGHAWGRIEIAEALGGERILLLDPAGEVEVVLVGPVTDSTTQLRLFGSESTPAFEAAVSSAGPILVDTIRPGNYRVEVAIGEWWNEPILLAEGTVDVVAGSRASLTLATKDAGATSMVPLSGTLVLPTAWDLTTFRIEFDLLDTARGGWDGTFRIERDAMVTATEPSDTYRWTAPPVQPGRYEVQLRQLGFHAVITVSDVGRDDAVVIVPPPCDVLIRCLEEGTGIEVTNQMVMWNCVVPEGVHGWSHELARWDGDRNRWRIRAPMGPILVGVFSSEYEHKSERFEAQVGTNELVLSLTRPTSLCVILRDGANELPWGDNLRPELVAAEAQGEYSSSSHGGGKITLHKQEPGRYRLVIPEIPGFEPVPVVDVRLEKGVVKEHVVELVRKP